MINVHDITKAAKEMVQADPDFEGFEVSRGEFVNDDPGVLWVGIYKAKVNYNTRTLGAGTNAKPWLTNVDLKIIVQAFGLDNSDEIEEELDTRVKNILDMFEADRTIKGTVNIINGYEVDYSYDGNKLSEYPFQNAMITVRAEVRA